MQNFLAIHGLEMTAVIAGLLNVYLAARTSLWNWLFGIITVSLYVIIFFHAKLYADMLLQFIFLALQFYGWYQWLRGGAQHSALNVRSANVKIYAVALIATFILFVTISYLLKNYTDSTTVYIDAFTTALSLVAQWMMSKKWIENWLLWMLVDIISIRMYLVKHLYFTTGLYFLFFMICVMGYYTWRKSLQFYQTSQSNSVHE
jgi:nicotinamide mononucleotide transporter